MPWKIRTGTYNSTKYSLFLTIWLRDSLSQAWYLLYLMAFSGEVFLLSFVCCFSMLCKLSFSQHQAGERFAASLSICEKVPLCLCVAWLSPHSIFSIQFLYWGGLWEADLCWPSQSHPWCQRSLPCPPVFSSHAEDALLWSHSLCRSHCRPSLTPVTSSSAFSRSATELASLGSQKLELHGAFTKMGWLFPVIHVCPCVWYSSSLNSLSIWQVEITSLMVCYSSPRTFLKNCWPICHLLMLKEDLSKRLCTAVSSSAVSNWSSWWFLATPLLICFSVNSCQDWGRFSLCHQSGRDSMWGCCKSLSNLPKT